MDDPISMFRLDGRIGIIIGGCGKMGREFALVLERAGATTILTDVREDTCQTCAEYLKRKLDRDVLIYRCDVGDEDDTTSLFKRIEKEFKRLDFIILNQMAKPEGYYRGYADYSLETWNRIHEINVAGTFHGCRKAATLMERSGGGSIVITSSIYGLVGPDLRIYSNCSQEENPYGVTDALITPAAYSSSKGALIALSKYLAVLLAPKGIRVNVLTPGGVYDQQEETFHNAYIQRTPVGRMATWTDYNGAILFLVSDASRYMTGSNIVIDGGWTAW